MKKFLSVYLGLSLLLLSSPQAYCDDNPAGVKPGKPVINPAMPNKDQNQLAPVNELMAKRIEELTKILKTGDYEERLEAIWKLADYGSAGAEVLIQYLEYGDPLLASHVIFALGMIGPAAKEAVPVLIAVLEDKGKRSWLRDTAAEALGKVGPAAAKAVPALIDALNEKRDDWLRRHAAEALGKVGPAAEAAIPALADIASKDNNLSDAAASALVKIAPFSSLAAQDRMNDFLLYVERRVKGLSSPIFGGFDPADFISAGEYTEEEKSAVRRQLCLFCESIDKYISKAIHKETENKDAPAKEKTARFEKILKVIFEGTEGAKPLVHTLHKEYANTASALLTAAHFGDLPQDVKDKAKEGFKRLFAEYKEEVASHPALIQSLTLILNDAALDMTAHKEAISCLAQSSSGHKVLIEHLKDAEKGKFILNALSQNASKNKEGLQRDHTLFLLSLSGRLEEGNAAKDRVQHYISTLLKEKPGLGLDFDKDKELFKPILAFDFKKEMDRDLEFLLKVYLHEFKAKGALELTLTHLTSLQAVIPASEDFNFNDKDIAALKRLGKALAYSFPKETSAKESFLEGFLITLHKNTSDTKLMDNAYYLLKEMSYYEQDTGGIFIKTIKELLLKNKKTRLFNDEVRDTLEYAVMEVGKRK